MAGTLSNMSQNIPVANARLAAQQKAARDLQLQAAVGAAKPAQATAATAQQLGTQVAQQAGAQQVAGVQQQAQAQGQVAQLGQQVQALADTKALNDQKLGLAEQQFDGAQQLAQISEQAKQEMYDSRKAFQISENGRAFSNERQLADYAKLRAGSEQEWQNYVQTTDQLGQRKAEALQIANDKLTAQLKADAAQVIQLREQAGAAGISQAEKNATLQAYRLKLDQTEQLRAAQVELSKSIARAQAKKAGTLAKNGAIGTIVGAGIGAAVGTVLAPGVGAAPGAAAGASLGGGLGTLATK